MNFKSYMYVSKADTMTIWKLPIMSFYEFCEKKTYRLYFFILVKLSTIY